MANPEHLAKLKEGVAAWNRWGPEFAARRPIVSPDFSNAILSGEMLAGTNFDGANLTGANLSGASLFATSYRMAVLSGADVSTTDLQWASFRGAILHHADFTGAKIGSTAFVNVDLSCVTGLETVKHVSPSTIGIDTIYRSQGQIPHIFLRGAGVPENFIELHGLAGQLGHRVLLPVHQLLNPRSSIRRTPPHRLASQRRPLLVCSIRHAQRQEGLRADRRSHSCPR